VADRPLYPISRLHLEALGGPLGIWQHAGGPIPNESFGYCTDDVARALVVDLLHRRGLGWEAVRASAWRSLRFLSDAFDPTRAGFRNFRAGDGSWLEGVASEDSQGRAMQALGAILAQEPEDALDAQARALFEAVLPAARRMTSPRAVASTLLGCDAALDAGADPATQKAFEELASRLLAVCTAKIPDGDWPWPEAVLTYENAILPQALLAAAARLDDVEMGRAGLRLLDWLIRVQTTPDGTFSPIGNSGWWPRRGPRSRFDQQPIEATSMILAAEAAFRQTGEPRYARAIEAAYGWFLGDNEGLMPLADPAAGSCRDGLTPSGANLNQGAESTLMWLTALEHVRGLRAAFGPASIGPVATGARS
jgi:hypothetical protein